MIRDSISITVNIRGVDISDIIKVSVHADIECSLVVNERILRIIPIIIIILYY